MDKMKFSKAFWLWSATFLGAAIMGCAMTMLLLDIHEKQDQGRQYPLMLNKVSDDSVKPEEWGLNFPNQYDYFKRMKEVGYATEFGGSLAYSKLIRYPQIQTIWAGYPFSLDYNKARTHYYAQIDQTQTKRNDRTWMNAHGLPQFQGQPGACMNCHSGWTPSLIRELGWANFNKTPYHDLVAKMESEHGKNESGSLLGGTCADCHSPKDMSLRVTRPAYINAMAQRGYETDPEHGLKATRREMRSHVCQQCHVEYYFQKGTSELTFPWAKWPKDEPLRISMIEAYYDDARHAKDNPNPFKYDWIHKITGAPMLKMQHPETELYSSGIHSRNGVACADCHMPYERSGSVKITNHNITTPLAHINNSCQTCHQLPENELKNRVFTIQRATASSLRATEGAILALIDDIKNARELLLDKNLVGRNLPAEELEAALDKYLGPAREMHRKAGMRWDFVFSENSVGFHSPQEAQRVLLEAINFARQGQLALQRSLAEAGIALPPTVGDGAVPAPPQPIEGHPAGVGDFPPADLSRVDQMVKELKLTVFSPK